jgi:hypothetical protein
VPSESRLFTHNPMASNLKTVPFQPKSWIKCRSSLAPR